MIVPLKQHQPSDPTDLKGSEDKVCIFRSDLIDIYLELK